MNKVRISGQRAYFFKTPEPVPKSQVGFSEIEFVFDSSWDEYPTRLAQFSQNGLILNVPIESNKCCVPSGLDVGVVTLSIRGDRADSSIASVNCLAMEVCCSFEEGGSPPVPPTPDLYNRLLADVEEAAKSAYPKGGTKGQVLTKMSDADRDFGWSDVAGGSGSDGGYYTPEVTQPSEDTMQVAFTASKESMPAVEAVSVTLPRGDSIVPPPTPEDAGKVLAVTSNGEAYELVSMSGGAGEIETIVEITADEAVSNFIVTLDANDDPFELESAIIVINVPAGGEKQESIKVSANSIESLLYNAISVNGFSCVMYLLPIGNTFVPICKYIQMYSLYSATGTALIGGFTGHLHGYRGNISEILVSTDNNRFTPGTNIIIYGVRARNES